MTESSSHSSGTTSSTAAISTPEYEREARRWQTLAQATGQILWAGAPDGQAEDSPSWRAFTGQTPDEARGWGWLDAVHPDDRERVEAEWRRGLADTQPFRTEFRLRRKDGEDRLVAAWILPVTDDDGRVTEWVGGCGDITERVRLREAAQERARQLEATLESIADALVICDASGGIVMVNSAFANLMGLDRDPAYRSRPLRERMGLVDIMHVDGTKMRPEEWPLARLLRGEVMRGDRKDDFRVRAFSGKDVLLNPSGAALRDESGRITGAVAVYRDVTERRRLETERELAFEEASRQSARLRTVLDVLPLGVSISDATGQLVMLNPAFFELWGENAPASQHIDDYQAYKAWWPESGEPVAAGEWAMTRALKRGEMTVAEECEIETFAGEHKTILNSAAPIRGEHGEITGAVSVGVDITARKQLERRLRASEQRTHEALDALLTLAEQLVSPPAHDETTTAEHVQGQHLQAIGRSLAALAAQVVGCPRVALLVAERRGEPLRPLATVGVSEEEERQWRRGDPESGYLRDTLLADSQARLLNGEVLLIDYTRPPFNTLPNPHRLRAILLAPLRIGGELVGVINADFGEEAHEYTAQEMRLLGAVAQLVALVVERERLLQQRMEAEARALALAEANQRMDEFLGIASHELRTPVTVLVANTQLLLRQAERAQAQAGIQNAERERVERELSLLRRMDGQLKRLNRLLSDLVDVSRIRADRLDLRPEPGDLGEIVREIVVEQRLAYADRDIRLEMPNTEPVPVFADSERIGQVVTNYLTNALKYSDATQPVAVRLSVAGRQARVEVRDHGKGIAPEYVPHIWEVFYRVPGIEVRTGSAMGLGLGLHICKTIIERHGGEVGLDSQPGDGSTFWFTLPLAQVETISTRV